MNQNLVVNPYLSIAFGTESADSCTCVAPKPGTGLQILRFVEGDQPGLYQLFRDLSLISLEASDVTESVSPDECGILLDHAILIDQAESPKNILFQCLLDEVPVRPVTKDIYPVMVNPTLRFEPVALENFRTWTVARHLSPYQPSVWVKDPVTNVESGYWLSESEAALISGFVPGQKPELPNDPHLVNRLLQAKIIVFGEDVKTEDRFRAEAVNSAREEFSDKKYTVLRSLFPPEQMAAMRKFYRDYIAQGFMPFGDLQVTNRYRQYDEPFAAFIHKMLAPVMSDIVGEPVKPSYCYAASYKDSAVLNPHTDRLLCEFSISFQVDYEPEPAGHLSPWGLYVAPFEWSGELPAVGARLDWDEFSDESAGTAVYLASGDGLIYKGRELVHYRYALPTGHRSTSLFFHYVAADFDDALIPHVPGD